MKSDIPKQYLIVNGLPIFMYSVRKFLRRKDIHSVVLVIAEEWKPFVSEYIEKEKKSIFDFEKIAHHQFFDVLESTIAVFSVLFSAHV